MSDISIPGVSSRFDTNRMVQELVDVERIRLTRLENRVDQFEFQRQTWQSMSRQLSQLQEVARSLYSFENPFNDRMATSSNENAIQATASRTASEGLTRVQVLELASVDRFASSDLPRDARIDQGVYTFRVGENPVTVRFRGGTVREFSEALNRVNPNLLVSTVINNRPGSQVFVMESRIEGSNNRIQFFDQASQQLGIQLRLISPSNGISSGIRELSGGLANPEQVSNIPIANQLTDLSEIDPERLNQSILRFTTRVIDTQPEPVTIPAPPGFSSRPLPGGRFQGVEVPSQQSTGPQPEIPPPPPPPRIDGDIQISISTANRPIPIATLEPSGTREFVIPISDLGGIPTGIQIHNPNTHSTVEVVAVSIEVPRDDQQEKFSPNNPLSLAGDARISVQGIEILRESNTIDDVIPGVTLNLQGPSSTPVDIRVAPDRERAKDRIIEFVAMYNQVIREINILTRNQPEIIDEVTFFTPDEREDALARLGSFQGNSTLNTIRQRLQGIVTTPIETRAGRDISLLSHIGISTNAAGGGATVNLSRLRGYLEINEQVLDRALAQNFLAVRDLFGRDSDGDLLVDSGIGFLSEQLIRPFTQTGGILASNTQTINSQINRTQTEISNYQRYLEDFEQRMRTQFGRMESAINSLEAQSREIQNMNPVNNQNR
jgi:flagellar hook-associated protein 2